MFEGLTQDALMKALIDVPEVDLKGLALLRQHQPQPGNIFPTGLERQEYIDATLEMVSYTRSCAGLASVIIKLQGRALIPSDHENHKLLAGYSL